MMSKYQVGELVEYWLHSKGKGPGEKALGIDKKMNGLFAQIFGSIFWGTVVLSWLIYLIWSWEQPK